MDFQRLRQRPTEGARISSDAVDTSGAGRTPMPTQVATSFFKRPWTRMVATACVLLLAMLAVAHAFTSSHQPWAAQGSPGTASVAVSDDPPPLRAGTSPSPTIAPDVDAAGTRIVPAASMFGSNRVARPTHAASASALTWQRIEIPCVRKAADLMEAEEPAALAARGKAVFASLRKKAVCVPTRILALVGIGSSSSTKLAGQSRGSSNLPRADAASVSAAQFSASALAVSMAPHPRLILDAATLTQLRQRAVTTNPQWKALQATCDSFIGGTVNYPTQDGYPNKPNAGSGYQGEEYLPALLSEGMCYQVQKTANPAAAASYGAKAVDILMKMSTPFSTASGNLGWDPCADSGYGIRFYGVGYGLGYDWVYELLTPAQRTQVFTAGNAWIASWEKPGGCSDFEFAHPQSNYFAGYFHAKAVIALGTYGDNPLAPAQWSDWLTNQFGQRVQPYYAQHLLGGGWPEGFGNYAPLGILNMSLPAREVMTATGLDVVHAAAPYRFPLDSADYAMHFTWPSRNYIDDRDTNHATPNTQPPGTAPVRLFQQVLGELEFWHAPTLGVFHQYLNEVTTATGNFNPAEPWLGFLELDPAAPAAPVASLPLAYFARGLNAVAARSDWSTAASWMSFRAGPYVNNPSQGEEYFDQGSLALVRGGTPLLLNAGGWLVHNPGGDADETRIYDDNYGKTNGSIYLGNRQLYNIFFVRSLSGSNVLVNYGQGAYTTEDKQVRTQVSAYEDGSDYVYLLATHLEDMYRPFTGSPAPGVTAWSRQVIYLRPNRFVVYDRTGKGDAGYDQYLAWHFPANPVSGAAGAGQRRVDITFNGVYAGAMTTVLPRNASVTTVPLYPASNPVKAWQVQVRPPDNQLDQQWLSVFDLSPTAAAVANASPLTVTQGAARGVLLVATDGNAVVVSSGGGAGSVLDGVGYAVPAAATHHVITDLKASTGYSIIVSVNGGVQMVSVTVGGTRMSSPGGVLDFYLATDGTLQNSPPVIIRVPVSTIPVPGTPQPYRH